MEMCSLRLGMVHPLQGCEAMSDIGTWKPAPISDEHLRDIERGIRERDFGPGLLGVSEWEIYGIIARMRAAEAVIEALQSVLTEEGIKESVPCYSMGIEMLNRVEKWLATKQEPRK